jgi:hypothetical protein
VGRRDAVQFTLEWAAEARRLGAIVEFETGWESRGNGTSADYEGGIVHHTAFLSSQSNPYPARGTLLNGRPNLPGPLCNVAGPWCPVDAPRLIVVSANPANHAGASGGRSMGPLPVTSLFNKRVFGLEIDYAGLVPMSDGQYRAALIFTRALANVLQRSVEYVRAHMETSVTGKWDPGHANGKTYDMAAFRQSAANLTPEDDMPLNADDIEKIAARTTAHLATAANPWGLDALRALLVELRTEVVGQRSALNTLTKAVAEGRDDLTAEELKAAVSDGIQEAGAALRAVQDQTDPLES